MADDFEEIIAGMNKFGNDTVSPTDASPVGASENSSGDSTDDQARTELSAADWASAARAHLDLMGRQDGVGHREEVYHLRIKFAWLAVFIVLVWMSTLILALLCKFIGAVPPGLVFAFSVAAGCVLVFALPTHCRRSKHAAENLANEYEKKDNSVQNIRSLRCRHRIVMYGTVRKALKVGGLSFCGAYLTARAIQCCLPLIMPPIHFEMSDSVAITLATTTTATVLGILFAVMHWLFPKGFQGEKHAQNQGK